MTREIKGSRAEGLIRAACAVALLSGLHACNEEAKDSQSQPTGATSTQPIAQPTPKPPASTAEASQQKARPAPTEATAPGKNYAELNPASWKLSELSDVAPAGPATATPLGVVMVTLDRKLVRGSWQPNGTVHPIDQAKSAFAPYGRGPALSGDYAYWIHGRHLLRRKLEARGKPEVLASDAREGTRVSAVQVGQPPKAVAAYIAMAGEELVARLWIETKQSVGLTPEGSQATSVNLIPSGKDLLAIILEGRTSMSPIHVRRLLVRGKRPRVEEDTVVWVGPPAQPLSEVVSLPGPNGDAWSFVALERTITEFGLARFRIAQEPKMDPKISWLRYPNGINPAPVATGMACGRSLVAFARPSEARPRSPQELHVAMLDGSDLAPSEVVARSRAFNNVSLAPVKGGALLTWTADWRTWARTIFCK